MQELNPTGICYIYQIVKYFFIATKLYIVKDADKAADLFVTAIYS